MNTIENEIREYISNNPKQYCTLTQMAKEGGLRERKIDPRWLKKKLLELVNEKRKICTEEYEDKKYRRKVTYYTLTPNCDGGSHCGVELEFIKEKSKYISFLDNYYKIMSQKIVTPKCNICKQWGKILNESEELGCSNFLDIQNMLKEKQFEELREEWKINSEQIENLKEILKEERNLSNNRKNIGFLFLEDFTLAIIKTISEFEITNLACFNCNSRSKCCNEGISWSKEVIMHFIKCAPKNDLKKFWEDVLKNPIRLKEELLNNYFTKKDPDDACSNWWVTLPWEDNSQPYFYCQIIPLAIKVLIEDIIKQNNKINSQIQQFKQNLVEDTENALNKEMS